MVSIIKSATFERWFKSLRDARAQARISERIVRLESGNPGDVKPVGDGVSEMRINYGPGYRVYFLQHASVRVVLLCGGDKSSQKRDIAQAKRVAAEWKDQFR